VKTFTELYRRIDSTTRTNEKVAAMRDYFATTPAADAAWALFFLTGRKVKRAVSTTRLREWAAEEAGIPLWLLEECYDNVGDLAETIALVLSDPETEENYPLHRLVEERILPLPDLEEEAKKTLVQETWRKLGAEQRFLWHKLIGGEFRVGVARTLVARAAAEVAGVESAILQHRLMGDWEPTAEDYRRILSGEETEEREGRPYPFFLAYPLEDPPSSLGDIGDWQAEWKWDGIRAQLLARSTGISLWSRGEELITDRFPEIVEAADALPLGTVMDGEVLAWKGEAPLPFGDLQTRIGRKNLTPNLLKKTPVAFMVYDLLEHQGEDIRDLPLFERRERLEELFGTLKDAPALRLCAIQRSESWEALEALQQQAREHRVEGLMLKRKDSPYGVGRRRGDWWKWKIDPFHVDAVLVYAQRGHGRRAGLFTDYTFAVWQEGELVPIAKAYSGLSDAEIREVDAFIRRNTIDRFGPVRVVRPERVFEIAFEGIRESNRHKSGVAVRFPRINRTRPDKKPEEADTLENLRALLAQ
jgi:DNA ligase-1